MELRDARAVVAVARTRNFTRAAAELSVAQSPLSQQVRRLERELGVELFTRSTRSVRVTYAGSVFVERATALLTAADEVVDAARKAAAGRLGRLTVGFAGSATYELLPSLVRSYADRYPDVTIDVRSDMVTPAQVRALQAGDLDIGILRPPLDAEGLAVETIRHEDVVTMVANRHPRSVQREIDLADLRDDWFIAYPPSTMRSVMESACHSAGFEPRIRQVVTESAAMAALVAADMGVALVPASLRHLGVNGATFRPLSRPRPTVDLAVAYRSIDVTPLVRNFLDIARTLVRSRTTATTRDDGVDDEPPNLGL